MIKGQLIHGNTFDIYHITDRTNYIKKANRVIFLRGKIQQTDWENIQKHTPCAVILEKKKIKKPFLPNVSYIVVEDMEKSYWEFVKYYRSLFDIPVFAITGTCGKTTAKEMITHILKRDYKVLATRKSKNAPYRNLSYLCEMTKETEVAVFETPVARIGQLEYSCKFFQPTIGMITNIGVDHLKKCGTLENYIQAKGEILNGLNNKGILILNADDEKTKQISLKNYKGKVVYFGIHSPADYKATNIRYTEDGMAFTLIYEKMKYEVVVAGYGEHQVYNALGSIAAVHQFGFGIREAAERLKTFKNLTAHLETFKGPNDSFIINDTWNANPTSIEASLKVMEAIAANKKKILILGSVSELGEHEAKYHQQIGEMIAAYQIDVLIATGKFANQIIQGAKNKKMKGKKVACETAGDIMNIIKPLLTEETALLIKTSMYDKSIMPLLTMLDGEKN